jgi:hypothetical protein
MAAVGMGVLPLIAAIRIALAGTTLASPIPTTVVVLSVIDVA